MKHSNAFSRYIQKLKYPRKILGEISWLIKNPGSKTYFPQNDNKNKWAISRDILIWLVRHKEVNRFYYMYGLDSKAGDREKEVLSYRAFRNIRDWANTHPKSGNFSYSCLLRDKFILGQLLTSLHFPTPKNIAFLDNGEITWLGNMKSDSLTSFMQETETNIDGFCKPLTGMQGEGVFPLRIANGKMYNNQTELSLEQLHHRIKGQYLLQERIAQHNDVSRLHPQSINTVRMVTFNLDGKVEVFCAALRMGTQKRSVDNWSMGGIVVGIDLETGKLQEGGIYKPQYGGRVKVHPDTGIIFLGYQLPFFQESVELACRVHRYFYGIHSIGWDIALTPEGPVFIEGNEDWDGSIPMSLERNFKSRFLKMFPNK